MGPEINTNQPLSSPVKMSHVWHRLHEFANDGLDLRPRPIQGLVRTIEQVRVFTVTAVSVVPLPGVLLVWYPSNRVSVPHT